MQTYNQRDLSRKRSSYLEKKSTYLPAQLKRTYERLEELEALARLYGMEEHIRSPFNHQRSNLSDQELMERHIGRLKKFAPTTKN